MFKRTWKKCIWHKCLLGTTNCDIVTALIAPQLLSLDKLSNPNDQTSYDPADSQYLQGIWSNSWIQTYFSFNEVFWSSANLIFSILNEQCSNKITCSFQRNTKKLGILIQSNWLGPRKWTLSTNWSLVDRSDWDFWSLKPHVLTASKASWVFN